jgi:hypothetical protein
MNLTPIATQAATDLKALIHEADESINESIDATIEEASAAEKKAKFTLTFKIVLDLNEQKFAHSLSYGTKRTLTAEGQIAT